MACLHFGAAPRLLVIRAGALGDCLLMLPALAALRGRFPDARIEVMGYPMRWDWVLGRELVDAVQPIERPGMHLLFCEGAEIPAPLQDFFTGYDLVLSYRPDPEGIFAANLRRLGTPLVLSQPPFPPPPPPPVHVADFALRLVTELGAPPPPRYPTLRLRADELSAVQPFFRKHDIDPARQRLVVLHPGSGSEAKRWPVTNFAVVAAALTAEAAVRLVIVTGFAEAGLGASLLTLLPTAPPLVAENWPLIPTAALLAHAAAFVGNDSGLTHLAAALGRPTVAVFGPTDPDVWGPRGHRVTIVQADRRSGSSPDELWPPDDPSGVQQVVTAVRRWLSADDLRQSPGDRSGPW
jgi:ADP-heptose:LPS heptosyltransferase